MKSSQAFARRQFVLVAVVGDRNAFDQFHGKVRATGFGRSGVQDFRDVVVVHHRECLPFRFETERSPDCYPCLV